MIKIKADFYKELLQKFPFEPTIKQQKLLNELSNFIFDDNNRALFLLKGYAGTGKTTTISTVVNSLWKVGKKAVLLAPTGRAAKVISGYSKKHIFDKRIIPLINCDVKKIDFDSNLLEEMTQYLMHTNLIF